MQKEIDVLREKLNFAEAILDKAPCFLYINEIGRIGEENTMQKKLKLNNTASLVNFAVDNGLN